MAAALGPAYQALGLLALPARRVAAFRHARTGIVLHLVPGGSVRLGQQGGLPEEQPVRAVTLAPFLAGRAPVRQEEWDRLGGERAREQDDPDLPAHGVSWLAARDWLARAGDGLRLPREDEWEHACRAGSATAWWWGERFDAGAGWCLDHAGGGPHPVREHAARSNGLGLIDCAGNVSEWCQDARETAPQGGDYWQEWDPGRVHRGGSFDQPASRARSSFRSGAAPDKRYRDLGLRAFRSL